MYNDGVKPYDTMTNMEVLKGVQGGYRMPKMKTCGAKVYNMMLRCWDADPRERPTFAELHAFFQPLHAKEVKKAPQSKQSGGDQSFNNFKGAYEQEKKKKEKKKGKGKKKKSGGGNDVYITDLEGAVGGNAADDDGDYITDLDGVVGGIQPYVPTDDGEGDYLQLGEESDDDGEDAYLTMRN